MGWIPKEEFKGDETKWRPAEEYVKRADELMPIMRSQLGKYEQKLGAYESEITNLKTRLETTQKNTEKMAKISQNAAQTAYKQALADIRAKQAQAVGDGNVEGWQALEDKKEALEKPEVVEIEKPPAEHPAYTKWISGNEWYLKDEHMRRWAEGYANDLQATDANITYDGLLKQIETGAKEAFPHKFENPNRGQATAVDTGSQRSSDIKPSKKTYDNLPAEAKAQCDDLVKQKIYTQEKYVKDYFEEE
jgi:hypothetical protein